MHWLLCEYITYRCQIIKPNGEKSTRKRIWCERNSLKLFQAILVWDLFNITLRRRTPTPALPEFPFKVITTRYGTVYHRRYNSHRLTAPTTWPTTSMDVAISAVMNQPKLEEFLGLALQYFWRVYIHMPIPMRLAAVLREPVVVQVVYHA